MYKVLLVDDEKLFTDYLQSVIDWHAQGCEICGVAADGENALALARAQHPDVVLLDINIPLMDGLEVCRRLRAERVHCAVVIVSAHSDFQFAQTAIKYDVSDYLLKPFDKAELQQTLQSCFEKVRAQRGAALRRAIEGREPLPGPALVAVMHCRAGASGTDTAARQIEAAMHEAGADCRWYADGGELVFCCTQLPGGAETAARFFAPYAGEDCGIALGDMCADVRKSYEHARQALENRVLAESGIICYEDLDQVSGAVFSQNDLMRLTGCLDNHDEKGVTALVRRLFGLEDGHRISFQYFLSVLSSLTLHMAQYYGKSRDNAEKLLAQQSDVMRDVADATNITNMTAAIENYIYELYSDCITIAPVTRRKELVEKINRAIEANYSQDGYTVEKMAAELSFDSSYLRRAYKTETGITILKAIENYRIREATRLLRLRTMRHSDIARLTGFGDPYYFSKRFKQIMGCTPSEYELKTKENKDV